MDIISLIWKCWMFEHLEDQPLAVMLIKIEQWHDIENRKNVVYTFSLAIFKLRVPSFDMNWVSVKIFRQLEPYTLNGHPGLALERRHL